MRAREAAKPVGKPPRRRRSPDEIMDKLLTAARAEFTRYGYAGATTAAIARRGEATEAQLFRYFPSKADLFREAVFRPMSEHIARFNSEALRDGADDRVQKDSARLYISELQSFLREHSRMLMSLIVARAYEGEGHPAVTMNSLDRYFERGAAALVTGLGRNTGVRPDLTVRISFAALLSCVLLEDWLFPEGLATPGEIHEAIQAFIVNGISTVAAEEA